MQVLLPEGWAAPIGYSNGIASDAGRLVFLAGQVGWDAEMRFASALIAPQFEQALNKPGFSGGECSSARRFVGAPGAAEEGIDDHENKFLVENQQGRATQGGHANDVDAARYTEGGG